MGVNPIDKDTIEVYVDYWHFDEGEIAEWAVLWNSIPWEISSAMEKAVMDGKVSFSRSGATSKNVNWLSLIIPNDANLIKDYLQEFRDTNFIPALFYENIQNSEYYEKRYDSSIKWINDNNHAVISNGPFYLESYAPESRTITVRAFDDESYPFKIGKWAKFEKIEFPAIKNIDMKNIIQRGEELEIKVKTSNSDSVLYFLTSSEGQMISSEMLKVDGERVIIQVPSENTKKLGIGGNNMKIFAISESVLKPDYYELVFIVTEEKLELPTRLSENIEFTENESEDWFLIILPIIIVIGIIIYLKKR
jgi:peptide/nickel transport system substrate-binding protein